MSSYRLFGMISVFSLNAQFSDSFRERAHISQRFISTTLGC